MLGGQMRFGTVFGGGFLRRAHTPPHPHMHTDTETHTTETHRHTHTHNKHTHTTHIIHTTHTHTRTRQTQSTHTQPHTHTAHTHTHTCVGQRRLPTTLRKATSRSPHHKHDGPHQTSKGLNPKCSRSFGHSAADPC